MLSTHDSLGEPGGVSALVSGTGLSPAVCTYIDAFFRCDPPPIADVWAEETLFLPKRVSTFEGQFRFTLVPWLREIVATVNDPDIRSAAFVCGTQSAKTTALKIIALYCATVLRINVVWLWPKADLGRSFSLTKLKPTVTSSEKLRPFIPANSDLFKNLEMHFEGAGTLNFVGSHSKVDSKSRSAGCVASDEIDDCAAKTENDADPITLLAERLKTFIEGKQYRFGSPTLAARPAWQNYLLGDQRHYFLPCPHCGVWQSLELRDAVWVLDGVSGPLPDRAPLPSCTRARSVGRAGDFHLRWDPAARRGDRDWDFEQVAATAVYHCVSCDHPISQLEKNQLVESESCRWFPTVKAQAHGHASYRLPALYPNWPGTTFALNATTYLQTHHTVAGAQSYQNNWRALPFGRGHDTSDREQLARLAALITGTHALGERVGHKTLLLVDVQRHYVIYGWFGFTEKACYLLDVGTAIDPESIYEVDDRLGPDFVLMDSRYRANEVYKAILPRRHRWFALRGEKTGPPLRVNAKFDPFTGEKEQGLFEIVLLHLNTYTWGEEMLDRLYPAKDDADHVPDFAKTPPPPDGTAPLSPANVAAAPAAPGAPPSLDPGAAVAEKLPRLRDFFLPVGMIETRADKLKQLYNEYIVEYVDSKGNQVKKWTENKNNHLFDLAKYAYASASFLGLSSLQHAATAKLSAALAAATSQATLPLTTPHGGTSLYPQQ